MPEETDGASGETAKSGSSGSGLSGKVPTLLLALNPILLLLIGSYLNAGIEQTKLQIDLTSARVKDLKTAAETATIAVHDRVDKVKVIGDFINDLSGDDERRRSFAIEAIFIALPDEAPRLVKVVEKFAVKRGTTDDMDVATAKEALTSTRDKLVADMFSASHQTRIDALRTLERGWTNDLRIIDLLIARAMSDVKARQAAQWATTAPDDTAYQQLASIYNTVQFLTNVHAPVDQALKSRIIAFATDAAPNSDDTRRLSAEVKERFR